VLSLHSALFQSTSTDIQYLVMSLHLTHALFLINNLNHLELIKAQAQTTLLLAGRNHLKTADAL